MHESDDEFDAFFRADFPALVAFLCRAGFEVETARDVAAEAMLHAYESWPALGDARAWVRRIAGRLPSGPDTGRDLAGDPRDDGRLKALADQHAPLLELLAELPDQQRVVLSWSLDGFTPAQIGEALRIAPATVRSNLRHARERLRRHNGLRERKGERDAG